MKPHPDHRFHAENDPWSPAYSDNMLAQIAINKNGYWSAEDSAIATDVLAWRLDYPQR